jgi:hypothetical protein
VVPQDDFMQRRYNAIEERATRARCSTLTLHEPRRVI